MSSPVLFLLGASHHKTPLELREKLALPADRLPAFHQTASTLPGMKELAVLNTCNRVEFYGIADSAAAVLRLRETFCEFQGFPPDAFASISHHAAGLSAIEHLLSVASGLDSQMLGETEILGQVKDAYAAAQDRRTTGPVLNRVFQKAFQHVKYVRTHTAITTGQISVANVAVDLALEIFGDLASTRILLLGAGDIGEKTAKAFQSRGAHSLAVSGRTLEKAMTLATELGAVAVPFEQREQRLSEYDVVVCSTAAPHAVIGAAAVAAAIRKRPARPLFLIDLALPRDVEPDVASLQNIFLYDLDDLAKIAEQHRTAREAELDKCRVLLDAKTEVVWKQVEERLLRSPDMGGAASPAPAG